MKKLFTSESVTIGHPDKIADQISDLVLDCYLKLDSKARVACETCLKDNNVYIVGEVTSSATIDLESSIRDYIVKIGYDNDEIGFNGKTCNISIQLDEQSPDIAQGVDLVNDIGAGDQGMMFGYACNETSEYMPAPIYYAHMLAKRLTEVRQDGTLPYLRPDGKTQVTFEYDGDIPVRIDTIVISAQHNPDIELEQLRTDIIQNIVNAVIPRNLRKDTKILVNPTGRFVIGGPKGDAGLTGRKIIVDTYGGVCGHGGGAFSGKDYTKVDRSASYFARYVAKNIVASKLASKCELQIAYAIGVAEPVSIYVNTFNTGIFSDDELLDIIKHVFDFKPAVIISKLNLKIINYIETAIFGHFGKSGENFTWELLDTVDTLKNYIDLKKHV